MGDLVRPGLDLADTECPHVLDRVRENEKVTGGGIFLFLSREKTADFPEITVVVCTTTLPRGGVFL
jgi:hypothetical protein